MTDKAYPELPLADYWGSQASPEDLPLYTADQMRAYYDLGRPAASDQLEVEHEAKLAALRLQVHTLTQRLDAKNSELRMMRERPAAGSGISDEQIAALRDKHGITSNGRGVQAFEQVRAFVQDILASRPAPATVGEIEAALEAVAVARYKVVPAHSSMFWSHAVVAGDGTQQLYTGREVECQNMAAKFTGAFLDGAFLALRPAAGSGISDAAVQALESIAAMTFDRWSEGYRAGQIAIAALDKLRVQTTEWGPAPVGNEADEPRSLADRLDLMADAQAAGSTAQSDLYAAATVWRKHLRGQPAPTQADSAPPSAQGAPCDREDFAWLVVQEACETEPADEDDPECIRILRRDLKTAVLAAFLRAPKSKAAFAAPGDEAQLLADAERYRWLRDNWGYVSETYTGSGPQVESVYLVSKDDGWDTDPDSLDAAIDAARQGEGGAE
ncbi:hypothetical protein [Xenophilus sp. Marseille-Q4582]|uniref:hypothetical protein n=1 Tax=Xenophilus sp. Marseille-Q4582 TaxID=2866600 RepID=UPI001CE437AE|nr:hypothetical protein [Xenophilus sp. Marseille-Q4582]